MQSPVYTQCGKGVPAVGEVFTLLPFESWSAQTNAHNLARRADQCCGKGPASKTVFSVTRA